MLNTIILFYKLSNKHFCYFKFTKTIFKKWKFPIQKIFRRGSNKIIYETIELFQELFEMWLSEFMKMMFHKLIEQFIKQAIENGFSDLKDLKNNLDETLKSLFEKEVIIDKK